MTRPAVPGGDRRGEKEAHVKRLAFFVTLLSTMVVTATGMFVQEEIRKVPVQRLVTNLQQQLHDNPGDVELRLNLARLHAMAYALKVTEFDARQKGEKLEPWFGHLPSPMPGPVRSAPSREHQERATTDLARALAAYREVVTQAPENAVARLGYAWALEEAGQIAEAVEQYRKAVELAWPSDREERGFFTDPVTTEAAERLKALLDPVKHAKELAALEEKIAVLEQKGRMITPLAIPLGPAPDALPVAIDARVRFDADGSGIPRDWTWIARDAGWLVYDPDGAGRITSALQWFGSVTFWLFWENGYHALGALDDNTNGELRGAELKHLAIWRDADQNGVSEAGEVQPLSAYRIAALSCRYVDVDDPWVTAVSPSGVTFTDGTARPTYDVILRMLPSHAGTE